MTDVPGCTLVEAEGKIYHINGAMLLVLGILELLTFPCRTLGEEASGPGGGAV